jgi:hypothetical protein
VSAKPPHPSEVDPELEPPPWARRPRTEPRLTLRQWWYVNRWVILVPLIIVMVIAGFWAAANVPVISTTHSFAVSFAPGKVANYPVYDGVTVFGDFRGGTLSGTFWAPKGTVMQAEVYFGSETFSSNNSSGSFHLHSSDNAASGILFVETNTATTVYVNGTQSYLVPLL